MSSWTNGQIEVIAPGNFTTVQDRGRYGFQKYGVTTSGPVDTRAHALANLLVGNDEGAEALEMTFAGGIFRFTAPAVIALTGADMKPVINGKNVPMYRAFSVCAGDTITFGIAKNGCRTYLAIAGGLDVPLVMGSKSTLVGKGLKGITGRKLEKGDALGLAKSIARLPDQEKRVLPATVYPSRDITLRVVCGPQDDCFSIGERRSFFQYGAEITNESDRQGCRLKRDVPLQHIGDGNIISDGIALGSIQIPPNGQPIIMLADRQTIGGYPKIGTVISVDLPLLAQSLPGMRVHFVEVGIKLAQDLYIREREERMLTAF